MTAPFVGVAVVLVLTAVAVVVWAATRTTAVDGPEPVDATAPIPIGVAFDQITGHLTDVAQAAAPHLAYQTSPRTENP